MENASKNTEQALLATIQKLVNLVLVMVVAFALLLLGVVFGPSISALFKNKSEVINQSDAEAVLPPPKPEANYWVPPAESSLSDPGEREKVLYGRELIVNTSLYFGPKGTVDKGSTNGMNCQNCHLNGGTKPFGNNYGSVASTYPRYRARSGTEEDITKRIADCFERSLNGKAPKADSKEMISMIAYINWLGKEVPKGQKAEGSGLIPPALMARAALPQNGEKLYAEKCQSCHGKEGEGVLNPSGTAYIYPPMWGPKSYNDGAGLYRISNFAAYAKYNMPLGASVDNPMLTDEEAWDLAAFVNSQSRPSMNKTKDWPKLEEKPFDHPFGPFTDSFSADQHKFGPFQPIKDFMDMNKKTK